MVKHKIVHIEHSHTDQLCAKLDEMAANGVILVQIMSIQPGKSKVKTVTGKPIISFIATCLVFQQQPKDDRTDKQD